MSDEYWQFQEGKNGLLVVGKALCRYFIFNCARYVKIKVIPNKSEKKSSSRSFEIVKKSIGTLSYTEGKHIVI